MTIRQIPSTGLTLKHAEHRKDGDGPQIIRLDLVQSKTRELLQQLKSGKKVSLQTGKQAAVHYGKEKLVLDVSSETHPAEIYSRSHDQHGDMYFSGRLSMHLEMVRAREDTSRADAALANLQNTLTSMKEEQLHNETTMMGKAGKHGQLKPMQSRKDHLLGSGLSRPSSPFLGSAYSPAAGPTSMPMLGGTSVKDKIRLEAMKVPVIHLLASKPMSTTAIVDRIQAPREECERLLEKVARDSASAPGKKELKDKSYRDLDVWRFPYAKETDREAAIEHAIHAFDRMRVEKTDNLWQMLLKAVERGKGKTLSRLNFDKPVQPPKPASAPVKKADTSDADTNLSPPKKNTTAQRVADKKGLLKEPAVKSRAASPAPQKKRDVPVKSTLIDAKFKSKERIEDSDEEASTIEVAPKQPPKRKERDTLKATAPSSRGQNPSPAPKKAAHKPSTSSSSSTSDNSDSSKSKASLKPPPDSASTSKSKQSPRPRHGSSPQKPSPLGSSPPANSTDFDSSSSTTTKGTSQSSAPSSPPSESEMPIPKQNQKYSPVVNDRAKETSENRATKRKQGDIAEAPPAKRQQVNGLNSKVSENITKPYDRPQLSRKISESERSSSPEKPGHARDEVVDKAKRFQMYYKRYKSLHDKISSTSEKNRDSKDMDSLWVMHKRLRDMKNEIWQDWDSVGQST